MATATARRTTTKRNAAIAVAMFTLPELAKGEIYAGVLLDEKGKPAHHLVLLAGQRDNFTWEESKKWAAAQGGELPSRKEQALLFANAAQHFERDWYWSSEQARPTPATRGCRASATAPVLRPHEQQGPGSRRPQSAHSLIRQFKRGSTMKRDLATAEALLEVPAPLFFNLVDRVLDLSTPRLEFSGDAHRVRTSGRPARRSARSTKADCSPASRSPTASAWRSCSSAASSRRPTGTRAKAWAEEQGGVLPSRIDGLVLFENGEKLGFAKEYYWTSAPYASDPSCAWVQGFSDGNQYYYHTSIKYRARAVRRVPIR
jgi:hypothetical protein